MQLNRSTGRLPVMSFTRTTTPGSLRSSGSRSGAGISSQSTSPARNAAAAVAGSGITIHSTRSTFTRFGPLVKPAGPSSRGT